MGANNYRWKYAVIEAYEPLKSVKGWKKCKSCGEFPRTWVFDNGSFAKCCCDGMYDEAPARSESIMSVHKRNNGITAEYDRNNLRIAWNDYIRTGEKQNKLANGRW